MNTITRWFEAAKPKVLTRKEAKAEILEALKKDLTDRVTGYRVAETLSDGSRFDITCTVTFKGDSYFDLTIDWGDR